MAEQNISALKWVVEGEQQIRSMADALHQLMKAQREVNTALGKKNITSTVAITKMLDDTHKMKQTWTDTATGVRNVKTEITEMTKRTKDAKQEAKGVLLSWQSIGRIIIGSTISRGIGRLLRELRQGAEEAIEFEIRISELRTISQDSQLSFEAWAGSIRQLSEEFGRTPLDILEGAYQTLSNQVAEGTEALGFLNQAQRLSLITASDVTDAVQALTATINAYNYSVGDARYLSDVFFKTIELGRLRLGEIANTIGRVEVIGAQLNVSFEELMASLSALTIQGIRASEAQTWLRNVMQKLIRPTERMQEIFEEWGVASGAAAVETYTWAGVIEKLAKVAEESEDALGEIGAMFNRIRATAGATGLTQNFKKIKDYLVQIKNAGASAAEAFKYMQESVGFKMRRELQRIANFFVIDIGRAGLKAIFEISEAIGGLTNWVKGATYALGLFAIAATGPAITGLAMLISHAVNAMIAFGTALSAATTAQAALNTQLVIFGLAIKASYIGLGALAVLVTAIGYAIIKIHLDAKKTLQGVAREYSESIMPAISEWQAHEAEVNADRMRSHIEVANAMRRVYLQTFADIEAAINRLDKIEEGRWTREQMLYDLKREFGTNAERELQAYTRIKAIIEELNYLLALDDPKDAAKVAEDVQNMWKDLWATYRDVKSLEKERMYAWKEWSKFTDKTGRVQKQYRLQEVDALTRINKLMKDQMAYVEKEMERYQEKYPITTNRELRSLKVINDELQEKEEAIKTAKERMEDYGRRQTEVHKLETDQLRTVLGLLEGIETKAKYFAAPQQRPSFTVLDVLFGTDLASRREQYIENAEAFARAIDTAQAALQKMVDEKVIDPEILQSVRSLLETLPAYYEQAGPILDVQGWQSGNDQLQRALDLMLEFDTQRLDLDTQVLRLQSALELTSKVLLAHQQTFIDLKEAGLTSARDIFEATKTTGTQLETTVGILNTILEKTKLTLTDLEAAILKAKALNEEIAKKGVWAGGPITRFASGGSVGSDTVPALLAPGEFVVNRNAARRFLPQLVAMNSGATRFNSGGEVVNNNIGDINVTVRGGDTSEITVRRIATELRREIRRGTVRLN